ncbi:MAG: heterodisulfide reductase-related iron-sulfur binding cluster, partial [bacterium]
RAWAFGNFRTVARWGSATAPLSSWLAHTAPARWAMDVLGGVDRRRPLPPFARPTFLQWWTHRARDGNGTTGSGHPAASRGPVALFADTFMIYNYPEIGQAAVELLEALGYEVTIAEAGCCGRTMISKGLLKEAMKAARRNVEMLLPLASRGVPVVGVEPSCILTFRDEVPDLIPTDEARMLGRHTKLIDEFLAAEHRHTPLPVTGIGNGRKVLLHGHCHQKTLAGTGTVREILAAGGYAVQEVDSGCCGMAGSFGFERDHYEVSMAVGERRLLPAVRTAPADTAIVAMGVSCRQQIAHGTGRRAVHLVELLNDALKQRHTAVR